MKRSQMKAPIVALGAAVALSGCVTIGGGEFDATKSFVETYESYNQLDNQPLVDFASKPTGTVSYSGGILVQKQSNVLTAKPIGLASDPEPESNAYIVAKMDVEVAFDDNTSDFTVTDFQRATAPISVFRRSVPLGAAPISIDEDNVVLGEAIDGSLTGSGTVEDNGIGGTVVLGSLNGTLTSGSGEGLQTYTSNMEAELGVRSAPGNEFLLGEVLFELLTPKVPDQNQEGPVATLVPDTSNEYYYGAGYAAKE
ncbi:MAG: hypothetical protein ACRBBK_05560 [Paracoccaceae bacterium]